MSLICFYENGGVYLDTDVELIKSIDDIVENGAFMGLEKSGKICVATGLGLGADKGLPLLEEILDSYHRSRFEKTENGFYETVVDRVTNIILKHGDIHPNRVSEVAGILIYPSDFFCPLNYNTGKIAITDNTRSIHYYTASWCSKTQKIIFSIKKQFANQPLIAKLLIAPLHSIDIIHRYGFGEFFKRLSKKIH